jgi:glycosyltransferase involved in cell wall biosynthesis
LGEIGISTISNPQVSVGVKHETCRKRPRIAILITKFYRGGAENLVYGLAPLFTHDLDVIVIGLYRGDTRDEDRELRETLEGIGVSTVCIGKTKGHGQLSAIVRLYCLLRAWKPDILHTHCYLPNLYGRIAGALARVRTTIVTHHNGANEFQDWHYWLERAIQPFGCCDVAVSQNVADMVSGTLHLDSERLVVVPNGINLPRFLGATIYRDTSRRQLGLSASDVLLLNVGHIDPAKGQETLLRAFAELTINMPNLRLMIAGASRDEQLHLRLLALARELHLEGRVRFLGVVEDVPTLLGAADVFVFPSLVESQGIAVLEAMAAGVPVVASSLPALHNMGLSEAEIHFVPPGDSRALAGAIRNILDNPGVARRLCAAAAQKAQRYSIQQTARNYVDLYRRLLSRQHKANTQE